jgi:hypothetical protein
MRRTLFTTGLVVIALGCGGARPQTPAENPPAPALSSPVDQPQPAPTPAQPLAPPPAPLQSTCEAPGLAYLVGKSRTMIPVPVDPSVRRVSCTTCPVTEDYRPDRTDIVFDANTGLIVAVKCG